MAWRGFGAPRSRQLLSSAAPSKATLSVEDADVERNAPILRPKRREAPYLGRLSHNN
jgi:hypothetical protein